MSEGKDEPTLLGSRRLASWAGDLGEPGRKLLGSRRLALKVSNKVLRSGDKKVEAAADADERGVKKGYASIVEICDDAVVTEPALERVEVLAKISATSESQTKHEDGLKAEPRGIDREQEWGEIMDVGSSPSRPDLPTLTA